MITFPRPDAPLLAGGIPDLHAEYLAVLDEGLRITGFSATKFGRVVMRNPNYVFGIRKGRSSGLHTVWRVIDFINSYPQARAAC